MNLTESQTRELPVAIYRSLYRMAAGSAITDPLIKNLNEETRDAVTKIPGIAKSPAGGPSLTIPLAALCRGLVANVYGSGGALAGSTVSGEIEPLLRPASVVVRAGARVLTNLVGDLSIGRELSATTFSWLHELEEITESDSSFGALNLTPHRCGGATSISSQLDQQTGGIISEFLMASLARGVGSALDVAALAGTGTLGQPLGLFSTPNVKTVTFGGAATWAKALDFVTQPAAADADDDKPNIRRYASGPGQVDANLAAFTGSSTALWNDGDTRCGQASLRHVPRFRRTR